MTASPGGARILVVDDDLVLRTMASRTLRHAGFEVTELASGEGALAEFGVRPAELLLLDVMMPGIDGYETCQRLRSLPQGEHVPVLMLTGLDDTESIERAFACGATDFITKPINWTLLAQRVRYALRASATAEAVRRSEAHLARAQQLAAMGSWTLLADGRMQGSSELMAIFGLDADTEPQQLADRLMARLDTSDAVRLRQARGELLGRGGSYQIEFGFSRQDGSRRTGFEQAERVADAGGRQPRIEGITQDITERVQARERIRQLSSYDEVTELPNRQFFGELALPVIERARRFGTRCAVIHLDLDHFKSVNDALGHAGGNAVLKTVAERLRRLLRRSDITASSIADGESGVLARFGGNGFTLLVTDLPGQQQAAAVCQRVLAAIAEPIEMAQAPLQLTASAGIAFFPEDAADAQGLARCAEQALYAAKAAGRACYHFFDPQMNAEAALRLHRVSELRHAIGSGQLLLHFQPKVDGATGALRGAEALVRWQHPERGLVPPGDFIPLAEDSGLILPLTAWVLDSACRQLRAWADAGLPRLPLSLNLPAASLAQGELVEQLEALRECYGLPSGQLLLEVTESMLMRDIDVAVATLAALRERGYGISLDDFGTGYSSLSYLKRLPLDELKIDRSFVTDGQANPRDAALVSAIITLARELGLSVVAEGVERQDQSAFLVSRGCQLQQGFLFSRPLPAADFERVLHQGAVAKPAA